MQLLSPPLPSSILTCPPTPIPLFVTPLVHLASLCWSPHLHFWPELPLNQKPPRRTCVCKPASQHTNTQKKAIKYVDQWQNTNILQSQLATMAINHLLCSTLSLFIVIPHPSHFVPTSPTPTHPSPLRLPFRYLAPGETVGRPCCCICL